MASQDHEKAMDGLLRRSLARDTAAKADCPDAELLAAYYERSLGADEVAGYDLHFSQCTRCREQLAAMAHADAGQEARVEFEEPVLVGARNADVRSVARATAAANAPKPAQASPETKPRAPRIWLDLRWLAPVAAVLVLGTFVFMRFASRGWNIGFGINNEVAVSSPSPARREQPAPTEAARESEAIKKSAESNPPADSGGPSAAPASAGVASNAPSAPKSKPVRKEEAPSSRASAPSGNTSLAASQHVHAAANAASGSRSVFRPPINGVAIQRGYSPETPPDVPAPEPSKALSNIPIAADSAESAPAPPPATTTEQKSVAGRNGVRGGAISSFGKMKTAQQHSKVMIATPDADVLYRTPGGGFIEISEDGGATWQRQLLDPSAEFTAGSAPEPRICWLVGRSGIVFLTEDGQSWRKLPSPTSEDLVVVVAKSASSATVTASDNQRWSTDDAGKNWHPVK